MGKFDKIFEEMMSGMGGVWGPNAGGQNEAPSVGNDDFYARGDARVPKVLGAKTVKDKKTGKKTTKIPMFRRNLPPTL
jgi:hypothetical protein